MLLLNLFYRFYNCHEFYGNKLFALYSDLKNVFDTTPKTPYRESKKQCGVSGVVPLNQKQYLNLGLHLQFRKHNKRSNAGIPAWPSNIHHLCE